MLYIEERLSNVSVFSHNKNTHSNEYYVHPAYGVFVVNDVFSNCCLLTNIHIDTSSSEVDFVFKNNAEK